MVASSVDLLVQIQIVDEVRRATSIARLEKKLRDGEAADGTQRTTINQIILALHQIQNGPGGDFPAC
jgi:hypothetical protein